MQLCTVADYGDLWNHLYGCSPFSAYLEGRQVLHGNCAIGHLTSKGYKQEEVNGLFLRDAYVKSGFLTGNYSHQEVHLRSDGKWSRYTVCVGVKGCGRSRRSVV